MIPPPLARLRSHASRIRRRFVPSGIILMYHRVASLPLDLWDLAVSPETFDVQLQILKAHRVRLLTASDMATCVAENRVPSRSVVLTFDDGYLDNLINARPILERHDAPATMYIPAGLVGNPRPFWWDRLAAGLFAPQHLPSRLDLPERCWEATDDRRTLYYSIWQELVDRDAEVRDEWLGLIENWAGAPAAGEDPDRIVDEDELRRLGDGDLVEIGSHGWSHSRLGELAPAQQHWELEQSRSRLEEILGRPIAGLSYPHGSQSETTAQLVRECGYAYACGSRPALVRKGAERFDLPRIVVTETGPEAFERFLVDRLLT